MAKDEIDWKEESIKKVLADLKEGEPFSYLRSSKGLVFGFRIEVDENTDEIEIYHTEAYSLVKNKFIKKKNVKKR